MFFSMAFSGLMIHREQPSVLAKRWRFFLQMNFRLPDGNTKLERQHFGRNLLPCLLLFIYHLYTVLQGGGSGSVLR